MLIPRSHAARSLYTSKFNSVCFNRIASLETMFTFPLDRSDDTALVTHWLISP